jgi:hypothetical protein
MNILQQLLYILQKSGRSSFDVDSSIAGKTPLKNKMVPMYSNQFKGI